jgi:cupin 2 domain-containing protein
MATPSAPTNLFAGIPRDLAQEQIDVLAGSPNVRIERIVSRAHASPEGFWYDQDWPEWVMVLQGSAGLLFEGEAEPRRLGPGDHVLIPAHQRHRVAWTEAGCDTIWLAVHFRE